MQEIGHFISAFWYKFNKLYKLKALGPEQIVRAPARLYSGQLCFGWVEVSTPGRRRIPLANQKVLR